MLLTFFIILIDVIDYVNVAAKIKPDRKHVSTFSRTAKNYFYASFSTAGYNPAW